MVVGERARLLKMRPCRPDLSRRVLVEAEVGQCDSEPVGVSGRPGQGDGFLVVSKGGIEIACFTLEHRTTAENVSNKPGVSGCPGQLDSLVDLGQCSGQIAVLEAEPAQLREGVSSDGVIA